MAEEDKRSVSIIGSDIVFDPGYHWLRRFIWLLLILSGLTLSTYQIVDRVVYFKSGPTAVSLEIRDNITLAFPKIMLCNNNPYNGTWIREKNLTEAVSKYQRMKMFAFSESPFELDDNMLDGANIWYNTSRLDAAIRFDAIIYWNSATLEGSTRSRFLTPVFSITLESICYLFNPPDELRQVISGRLGGLYLHVLTHRELDPALDIYQVGEGYRLFVLSTDHSHNVQDSGILLRPGTFTNVPLNVREYNHLPIELGGICKVEQEESRSKCYMRCVMEASFSADASCRSVNTSSFNDLCPLMRSLVTGGQNYVQIVTDGAPNDKHCLHQCKVRCHELEYDTGSVTSQLLTTKHTYPHVYRLMKYMNATPDDLVADVVALRVYFPTPRYSTYTQMKLYSFWALLCDMGGAMGLFVGSAVFTIIEAVDISLYRAYRKCIK